MTGVSRDEKIALIAALAERERRARMRKFYEYFPETGPYRRELYQKHMEFFRLGYDHSERIFMAANRVGKSESGGGYELTCHLTGIYPAWWEGKRFDAPISAWAAGDTSQSVKEILQAKLLGKPDERGTGVIPGALLGESTAWVGVPESVRTIQVMHVSGRWSTLTFKSYDQKRISFQGTEQHVIWLDEEPPEDIVDECRLRTTATGKFKGGILMATFTPVEGVTPYIQAVMEATATPNPYMALIGAGWDDVPHLDPAEKARLLATMSPHQRAARTTGVPALGSGLIFPVEDDMITVTPFALPTHWPRIAAFDFGWDHPTVVLWGALDRDTDTLYVYSEHAASQTIVAVHADVVKTRGAWIPVAWPHDGNNDTAAGPALAGQYREKGLNMLAQRAQYVDDTMDEDTKQVKGSVEGGLSDMLTAMYEGRLKIFTSCSGVLNEKRWYRREKGLIVKKGDDHMAALRYLWISREYAQLPPRPARSRGPTSSSWKVQ